METKKFSAFKLFYDEFIYKDNDTFYSVNRKLSKIYNLVSKIRKCPIRDEKYYQKRLEYINKRIRQELNDIYKINPDLYEYYFILYKAKIKTNDTIKDMPFIISTSFYNDYRLDNILANPNVNYLVPKYNSLEKKEIRSNGKNKTKIEFLIDLLNTSFYHFKYNRFIRLMNSLSNELQVKLNEKETDYMKRVSLKLDKYSYLLNRIESKIASSLDADTIYEKFKIAYHKDYTFTEDELHNMLIEHFKINYKNYQENNEIVRSLNVANTMSYESYKSLIADYLNEKNTYTKLFNDGELEYIHTFDNMPISKFKEVIINNYFDIHYLNNLTKKSKIEDYVNRAIDLYNLSHNIEIQCFEKTLFDASHSSTLNRNRNAETALIIKLYDLYNPYDLLPRYDSKKVEFEQLLLKLPKEELKKYNTLLLEKKVKYDYHGPIPTSEFIKTNLNNKKSTFIYEHFLTEIKNKDITRTYDTRNYDLNIISSSLSIEELTSLYERMKYKVSNFDFSSFHIIDKTIDEDIYEKNIYYKDIQEFITKNILKKLDFGPLTEEETARRYLDICYSYLKEECLFIPKKTKQTRKNKKELYLEEKTKFNKISHWAMFLKENKISR